MRASILRPVAGGFLLFLAAGLSACAGGGSGGGAAARGLCDASVPPVRVVWDRLDPLEPMPLPSDYFTLPDPTTRTGLRLNLDRDTNLPPDYPVVRYFDHVLEELNTLDGWATSGAALVGMTGAVDLPASGGEPERSTQAYPEPRFVFAGADAAIAFVNVDPASARYGERRAVVVSQLPDEWHLVIEPLRPLESETRYALVMTKALVGAGGVCAAPSEAFARMLDGGPDLKGAEKALSAQVRESARDAAAVDPRYGAESLLLAMDFTTQSTVSELRWVRDYVDALPEPEILPGTERVETPAGGPTALRLRGKFLAADFAGPEEYWEPDGDGGFVHKRDLALDFVLQIPRESAEDRQPFPLAVFLHGVTLDLEMAVGFQDSLAAAGLASIAISDVGHRNGNPISNFFDFFNLADIFAADPTAFRVIRENFRQSALDQYQAIRLARRLLREGFDRAEPLGTPDLAADLPMAIVGTSLGGVMGPTLGAMAPDVGVSMLFAGGGSYSRIMARSPAFRDIPPAVLSSFMPRELVTPSVLALTYGVIQTMVDKSDSVNFAAPEVRASLRGGAPESLLLTEAVHDEIVTAAAGEALMRALEAPVVSLGAPRVSGTVTTPPPAVDDTGAGATMGVYQYDAVRLDEGGPLTPANHGNVIAGVEPQRQFVAFIRSYYRNLADGRGAEIVDPFAVAPEE